MTTSGCIQSINNNGTLRKKEKSNILISVEIVSKKLLICKEHEVTVFINTNEPFIPCSSVIALTSHPKILDLSVTRHSVYLETPTYKRDSKRIDSVFCTHLIDQYIERCGIFPFDTLSPSDHRAIYIDLKHSIS